MVFSSIIFLFYYLPLALASYYGVMFFSLRKRAGNKASLRNANIFLLFASLFFYIWGERLLVLVMLTSCVIDYFSALFIQREHDAEQATLSSPDSSASSTFRKKLFLSISIVTNLSLLGFFKYFGFFTETVAAWGVVPGSLTSFSSTIVLPLGISFYTFQSMSYTIDVYYGQVKATRSFSDFCCFVTLFPQLIAGPIVRYRDVATQLVERRFTAEKFSKGIRRFILGLGKKVLVANTVAVSADKIFALSADNLTTPIAWIGIVCYTFQIYFDFSGYSDMAIGLGYMLGFKFPENFNYPYISTSIQEFWRRWHMSLSTWFRDYLYIPLGGSRGTARRTVFNLVTVFLLCGLWHGASWNFIVWGGYHGIFLMFERLFGHKTIQRLPRALRHVYVMLVVMISWVLFRAETLSYGMAYIIRLFGLQSFQNAVYAPQQFFQADIVLGVLVALVASMPVYQFIEKASRQVLHRPSPKYLQAGIVGAGYIFFAGLALLSAMSLSSGTYNPFIYFRF